VPHHLPVLPVPLSIAIAAALVGTVTLVWRVTVVDSVARS
jgi:hypothetical protein